MQDVATLRRLDSFPYRHRLADVMATPVVATSIEGTLALACRLLDESAVSSLVIHDLDGQLAGILTNSDIVRHLARLGPAAFDIPIPQAMTAPVETVQSQDYLYVAMARMDRLGLSHLVVVDADSQPVGMVTARQLLKVRANNALVIGDDIVAAETAEDLRRCLESLPSLARHLQQDGTPTTMIGGVIAGVVRDMTRRAGEIAEASLVADGWGAAPARYALLVLGSAGRGESLLAFDQDNAIVYDGDTTVDPWFAEFGERLTTLLHAAGIPLCPGHVMARTPFWRRSLEDWRTEIRRWVFEPDLQTVLHVDIFFDLVYVQGDRGMADSLKQIAFETIAQSGFFQQLLLQSVARLGDPFTVFGRLQCDRGLFDAKKFGLLPLVSTARARALQHDIRNAATAERYRALSDRGQLHETDRDALLSAFETILSVILDQQLADLAEGRPATSKVNPSRLSTRQRTLFREALQRIRLLRHLASNLMQV